MRLVRLPSGGAASLGGKGEGLNRLLQLALPVPPAFVIPAEELDGRWPLDGALISELASALELIGPTVAVRSSGLGEDSQDSSFAGQHETILNVAGLEAVCEAVRQCWASAFSERAASYREMRGLKEPPRMAVVVQRQLAPTCAGVLFTRSPTDPSTLVIEAVRGLGEALVSGRAAPERIVVTRSTRAVTSRDSIDGGIVPAGVIDRLVALGLELETALGGPQDLEWAAVGEEVWLLQARPITTTEAPLSEAEARLVWGNSNAGELLPDVATPMTFTVLDRYVRQIFGTILGGLGMELGDAPIAGFVGGRLYFCMNTFMAFAQAVPGMSSRNPAELFGGHAEAIVAALARVEHGQHPTVRPSRLRFLLSLPRFLYRLAAGRNADLGPAAATVQAETRRLAARPLASMSDAEVLAHFEELLTLPIAPFVSNLMVGMSAITGVQALCKRWLNDGDGSLMNSLLTGVGGLESAESGHSLWALAEQARAGELTSLFTSGAPWAEVRPSLERTEAGRSFLRGWDDWMDRHGHHARAEIDVAQARWSESPDHVLATLRTWLGGDARLGPADAAARREALERQCQARLGPVKRRIFRAVLSRAHRGLRLRENIKSEAVRRVGLERAALLELGGRLVERGAVERRDDVFFLSPEDLRAALASPTGARWRKKVAAARREHARWSLLTPPPVVIGRLDPADAVPPPVPDAPVLKGLAVSAGVVEGIARVVLRSDEDARVLPGEILVAPFTDPGWAPYFVAAAGLVVDLGGMLSHGSIIAREYGIPAVVNVGHGTRRISTGQRIRVDGFRGEVTIL